MTEELGPELASRYLQLNVIFRWEVEIGRVDILLEVSLLSQYQAGPRSGHLEVIYDVFAYLREHKDMGIWLMIRRHQKFISQPSIVIQIGRISTVMWKK